MDNPHVQQVLQAGHLFSTERPTEESPIRSPLLVPSQTTDDLEKGNIVSPPSALTKGNPSFHLLITGANKGAALCRNILSAAVLDYPPPTLVDYAEGEPPSRNTLRSVREYIQDPKSGMGENDLVLMVDTSTFFQLPASVFIHRHEAEIASAKAWSREEYGRNEENTVEPRFDQEVFTGAAKTCALPHQDGACKAVPESPVRASTGRELTSRYLDSGTVIGLVPAVSKVLNAATDKMEHLSPDHGSQTQFGVMTKVFGDQELFRRATVQRGGFRTGWNAFISGKKPEKLRPTTEGGEGDYGICLDYSSSLFKSSANSDDEITMVTFDNRTQMEAIKESGKRISLPKDLTSSGPLFRPALTSSAPDSVSSQSAMPYNSTIDDLPNDLNWEDVPLAVNLEGPSVPAILHLGSTSSAIKTLLSSDQSNAASSRWRQLWFHPYARAMMRHHIRSSEGTDARHAALAGGDHLWSIRGGKGGAWTVDGTWLSFAEVCRGYEKEVFGDGMGQWGLEGGGHPRCNLHGELVSGEGECEPPGNRDHGPEVEPGGDGSPDREEDD